MSNLLPLLVEPQQLADHIKQDNLLILDVGQQRTYQTAHLPNAIHVPYNYLIAGQRPAVGQLPPIEHLTMLFSQLGLTNDTHVVAYDDAQGANACRLLWTLDSMGHSNFSLLNGGIHAWHQEGFELNQAQTQPTASQYQVQLNPNSLADITYIQAHLDDPQVQLLDARTHEEYSGSKAFAKRSGHIPGAIHFNWLDMVDEQRNYRMKSVDTLLEMSQQRGIDLSKEIIAYCQTHHRSSYSYIALKVMGCQKAKGYAGSWSEWGSQPNTPIEN